MRIRTLSPLVTNPPTLVGGCLVGLASQVTHATVIVYDLDVAGETGNSTTARPLPPPSYAPITAIDPVVRNAYSLAIMPHGIH